MHEHDGRHAAVAVLVSVSRGYYTISVMQTDPVSGLTSGAASATVSMSH